VLPRSRIEPSPLRRHLRSNGAVAKTDPNDALNGGERLSQCPYDRAKWVPGNFP
jgi:hypothetical protein